MPRLSSNVYSPNLAFIHDAGFGHFATNAAGELLRLLRRNRIDSGRVIDLGCGSGILAEAVADAGYDVVGYDLSPAMIALSKQRVPEGDFRQGSFLDAELPRCAAVTAIGEVFNYLFDSRNKPAQLRKLFGRVHAALQPGGLFLFDVATPGRVPGGRSRNFREGDGWACLFTAEEGRTRRTLTRRIVSFRKVGQLYRRDAEVHRQRLYEPSELLAALRSAGFQVRTLRAYGKLRFPPGYAAFLARKR